MSHNKGPVGRDGRWWKRGSEWNISADGGGAFHVPPLALNAPRRQSARLLIGSDLLWFGGCGPRGVARLLLLYSPIRTSLTMLIHVCNIVNKSVAIVYIRPEAPHKIVNVDNLLIICYFPVLYVRLFIRPSCHDIILNEGFKFKFQYKKKNKAYISLSSTKLGKQWSLLLSTAKMY